MKLFTLSAIIVSFLAMSISADARDFKDNRNSIEATISPTSGHLFDWSLTDRRIKTIMVDNPEVFMNKFLFVADGCTVKQCKNSSLLLVSSRPGAAIGQVGTLRVITLDRKGNSYTYTIKIKLNKNTTDNETRFTYS
jgi:hypothetical protein